MYVKKTAHSRQALGGHISIVTFATLLHNREQIKQASKSMKKIQLNGKRGEGHYALVSDEDYTRLSEWRWLLSKDGYAYCVAAVMHRMVMQPDVNMVVDHINGDRLDNRRSNLRNCTHKLNMRNRAMPCTNVTGYKGVARSSGGRVTAQITVDGELIKLGRFISPVEAAKAYNSAAIICHGDYARLNKIEEA